MSETYYLSYDPEELYKEMQMAYAAESGEILWPGDEKETLLRAAESIFIQALAGVDHALRMGTLRYAVGDYLDLIGENRGCIRNKSRKARAEIEIQAEAGEERTIRAGSQLTADGDQIYTLRADVVLDEPGRRVLRGGRSVELTETEFEILCFLAAHRGSVVSVEQIYRGVWREKYMPSSTNTVMVHIVNLRKKLEEDPTNPRLIRTVWGKGYQID